MYFIVLLGHNQILTLKTLSYANHTTSHFAKFVSCTIKKRMIYYFRSEEKYEKE